MEPKTIEVRVPDMKSRTNDRVWARRVDLVPEKAKTGNDWEGDWLKCDRLFDFKQGDLFVTCGQTGTARHPCKYVQLHIAIDEAFSVMVASVESNEWAVKLRDIARKHLVLGWQERCVRALADEISFQEKNIPEPTEELKLIRSAATNDYDQPGENKVFVASQLRYYFPAYLKSNWQTTPEEVKSANRSILAMRETEFRNKLEKHEQRVAEMKAMMASFPVKEVDTGMQYPVVFLSAEGGKIEAGVVDFLPTEVIIGGVSFISDTRGSPSSSKVAV